MACFLAILGDCAYAQEMANHKFQLGEAVLYKGHASIAARGPFSVTRHLPSNGVINFYRIKSDGELVEHVADEEHLERVAEGWHRLVAANGIVAEHVMSLELQARITATRKG